MITGSSPRVWGQVIRYLTDSVTLRIIPTRMGTSLLPSKRGTQDEDHPHAYGDKLSGGIATLILLGSSPRVWGQAGAITSLAANFRIIPTRVGTS